MPALRAAFCCNQFHRVTPSPQIRDAYDRCLVHFALCATLGFLAAPPSAIALNNALNNAIYVVKQEQWLPGALAPTTRYFVRDTAEEECDFWEVSEELIRDTQEGATWLCNNLYLKLRCSEHRDEGHWVLWVIERLHNSDLSNGDMSGPTDLHGNG